MSPPSYLRTERLVLRRWRDEDRAPFAAMNADAAVMEHFPALLGREESDAFVDRIETSFEQRGYGLWAVEVVGGESFVGFVGLWPVPDELPFAPAVEVGWRLARSAWGRGYASEAARAALADGAARLGLREVVSMTAAVNERSQAVMRRLGMTRDRAEDFTHPRVPAGHPVRPHVLHRLALPAVRGRDRHRPATS